MSADPHRGARRLLRCYPASWRQRYGEEFVALMEDELAEHPNSSRRTFDVMHKGLKARCADLGLLRGPGPLTPRIRSGVATTAFVSVLFTAVALHPWAFTMLAWNGWAPKRAGLVQTITTGTMTLAVLGLVAVLAGGVVALGVLALRQMFRRPSWKLGAALAGVVIGLASIIIASNNLLRDVVARGGIEWAHPGLAIKQLAGAAYTEATAITITTFDAHSHRAYDLWQIVPIFSIALIAVSVAFLLRHLEFRERSQRVLRVAALTITSLMGLAVLAYLFWFVGADVHVFGGNDSFEAVSFSAMLIAGVAGIACVLASRGAERLDVAD